MTLQRLNKNLLLLFIAAVDSREWSCWRPKGKNKDSRRLLNLERPNKTLNLSYIRGRIVRNAAQFDFSDDENGVEKLLAGLLGRFQRRLASSGYIFI
jgi:hypothetical protein